MEDHRRFRRFPFRQSLRFAVADREVVRKVQSPEGGTLACDLSATGLRFWADDFIPLRTNLDLQLQLNSETQLDVKGEVVWSRHLPHSDNYQVGVLFQEKRNILALKTLESYVAGLAARSGQN